MALGSIRCLGEASVQKVMEITGRDGQGNAYSAASSLMYASLHYDGNSTFTLTLKNTSEGTGNETPFSPGVWAVSYYVGETLDPNPIYKSGTPSVNGLTALAEMGNNTILDSYIASITGIFTPLSPVLVVIYNGIDNPIYKIGEKDKGQGLKDLAQKGDARVLAEMKNVYVLAATDTKVLLPMVNGKIGGNVSQILSVSAGDMVAIATMYGLSNYWFFASQGNGSDAAKKGDISSRIILYNNGTAIDQFPGAGITQFNLMGTPLIESTPISAVPNPNAFTTLPDIGKFIKVVLQ